MLKKILLVLLLLGAGLSYSQVDKFKAMFVYHTGAGTKFPGAKSTGDFVIGFHKNVSVRKFMEVLATKKKISGRKIIVVEVKSTKDVAKCNVLFVSSKDIPRFSAECIKKNTLLYSEGEGTCTKGAHVSFYLGADKKPKFEYSSKNLKAAGLKVSPKLLGRGKNI